MASVAVIYGCRKDLSKIGEISPLTLTDPKISAAKSWYENNFPKQEKKSGQSTQSVGDEFDLSQYFSPNWNKSKNYIRFDYDVIEMPLDSASKIALKIGSSELSQYNSRSTVLILRTGKNYSLYNDHCWRR
ncbi:hypothetical protein EWM62_03920 [Mucilaginibacter terrigena]|uniref:Uncharacterized protein n=1 Tax=Mucilaginibacter terrigena TaxID=2492395 RepID=A0A4Q5LNY9_9SPHI|nr:hypothetical protein [Mucilaginibacter terrigena]RYU87386.1 hypothetical protein EWM62_16905 [Mucilaginibacter terrigena]RYU91095.1 hypothetical protein EWM62_03920 [Mucilaginibacter terrigena]